MYLKPAKLSTPTTIIPSVYTTTRSTVSRSRMRTMRRKSRAWYRRPLIKHIAVLDMDIQRGALFVGALSMCLAVLSLITTSFDLYCYALTIPGSTHYGYFFLSYEFVYVGNPHVRNLLIAFASILLLLSVAVAGTGMLQIQGVRNERERLLLPWLVVFAGYIVFRILALILFAIVNDLIFAYNLLTVLFWSLAVVACVYGWLVVHSMYLQLCDLSRLEDIAHLRVGAADSAQCYERLRHFRTIDEAHRAVPEIFDTPTKHASGEQDLDGLSTATPTFHTTVTTPVDMEAGPSRSVSFFTETDFSIATTSTMPIEQVVYERYLGNI